MQEARTQFLLVSPVGRPERVPSRERWKDQSGGRSEERGKVAWAGAGILMEKDAGRLLDIV